MLPRILPDVAVMILALAMVLTMADPVVKEGALGAPAMAMTDVLLVAVAVETVDTLLVNGAMTEATQTEVAIDHRLRLTRDYLGR